MIVSVAMFEDRLTFDPDDYAVSVKAAAAPPPRLYLEAIFS